MVRVSRNKKHFFEIRIDQFEFCLDCLSVILGHSGKTVCEEKQAEAMPRIQKGGVSSFHLLINGNIVRSQSAQHGFWFLDLSPWKTPLSFLAEIAPALASTQLRMKMTKHTHRSNRKRIHKEHDTRRAKPAPHGLNLEVWSR